MRVVELLLDAVPDSWTSIRLDVAHQERPGFRDVDAEREDGEAPKK